MKSTLVLFIDCVILTCCRPPYTEHWECVTVTGTINPTLLAGNPSPRLTWWREHALVDDSYEVVNGATVNALRIAAVRNTDLGAVFVCQAVNNNISFPVSTSLRMDISCKLSTAAAAPLRVQDSSGSSRQDSCFLVRYK